MPITASVVGGTAYFQTGSGYQTYCLPDGISTVSDDLILTRNHNAISVRKYWEAGKQVLVKKVWTAMVPLCASVYWTGTGEVAVHHDGIANIYSRNGVRVVTVASEHPPNALGSFLVLPRGDGASIATRLGVLFEYVSDEFMPDLQDIVRDLTVNHACARMSTITQSHFYRNIRGKRDPLQTA